jgi:hypothetical protein
MSWENDFRVRLDHFEQRQSMAGGIPVSIKIRVTNGCFHREHSPKAYEIIDASLHSLKLDESISFYEHESGPELLVYLALGTAGINLTISVINLITTILKARSEGIKKGDHPSAPLELIVRSFDNKGRLVEEKVLHIDSQHTPDKKEIEQALDQTLSRILPVVKNKSKRP